MPVAVREQVLSGFFAALSGIAGVTAVRGATRAMTVAEMPFVMLVPGAGHEAEDIDSGGQQLELRLTVACGVTAADDVALEQAVNDLHARVVAAAMADQGLGLDDPGDLGPTPVSSVRETGLPPWDVFTDRDSGVIAAIFSIEFAVVYEHEEADPFRRPGGA